MLLLENPTSDRFAMAIDDIYINDDLGAVNNTYLGNARVQCSFASGPGGS